MTELYLIKPVRLTGRRVSINCTEGHIAARKLTQRRKKYANQLRGDRRTV